MRARLDGLGARRVLVRVRDIDRDRRWGWWWSRRGEREARGDHRSVVGAVVIRIRAETGGGGSAGGFGGGCGLRSGSAAIPFGRTGLQSVFAAHQSVRGLGKVRSLAAQ